MPALSSQNNQSIKDFFKPFTIPKKRIPLNDVVEEEIVVASPRTQSSCSSLSSLRASASPVKRLSGKTRSGRSSNASTPTKKRSPTKTPTKRFKNVQLDGAADDDTLIHVSPSSAKRREMEAVEIPTPRPAPPAPPHFPREAPTRAATTSFSSVSTLSSVPMSSQSSSKRIMKNGIQAVTNSDSGSAGSDSDELADVSTFIPRKRLKMTPPGKDAEHAIEIPSTVKPAARQSARLSDQSVRASRSGTSTPRLPPSPPRTAYKYSLANMIKQQQKQEKEEARIREADAAFEEAQRRREEEMRREEEAGAGLKAAVADDSDEGERMMLAMARTEALQNEEKFYYFRHVKDRAEAEDFPELLDPPWSLLSRNEQTRTQAFLTGFVSLLAGKLEVPRDLQRWLIAQLALETRHDLCEAYAETLHCMRVRTGRSSITLQELSNILTNLSDYKTRSSDERPQQNRTNAKLHGPPPGLRHLVQALEDLCATITSSASAVANVLFQLMLAGIDEHVVRDADLQSCVHNGIEQILNDRQDEEFLEQLYEWTVHSLFKSELSLQLRCRVVASLPAYAERGHRLRRLLALHIIASLDAKHEYRSDATSPDWADIILFRLKTAPQFATSESTNYALLDPLISVLNIAVDAGFSTNSSSHPKSLKPLAATKPANSVISDAETTFNAQIDALTSQLRQISSRIRDAGTSHLRRAEAKSSIERLVVRLEYSVRTKPKPRKGIFGGMVSGEQRNFLSGFLKKEDDAVSVVPVDMLSEREVSSGEDTDGSGNEAAGADAAVAGAEDESIDAYPELDGIRKADAGTEDDMRERDIAVSTNAQICCG
ncbi:hypothetical protein LTR37_018107 [Vermiconidia calcicola]|uniref:Uncharacterized protein n=1 Tax=Vermiconidia calcicola TaxID=1690605 RepID=A0ACC3MJC1_9PEZI|nr:hypothetical protein LTR37_018107 [Vermiconidia calcicola]